MAESSIDSALASARALESDPGPEPLHELRVALRRLRSIWWAYAPLLEGQQVAAHREQFRRLADAAGATRDWDVLHEILVDDKRTAGAVPLLRAVEKQRADALSYSRAAIGSAGLATLLRNALTSARRQLEACKAAPSVAAFAKERVRNASRTLDKRLRRVLKARKADYRAVHRVRIATKKLRYLLEFFAPVLGHRRRAAIKHLTSVQKSLGSLNDIVASEALVERHAAELGGEGAVAGLASYARQRLKKRKKHLMRVACRRLAKLQASHPLANR
jgi:CHAD domain-containing protein